MSVPPVLLGPDFAPLWRHLSARLERLGLDHRGDAPLPAGLAPAVYARLGEVLDRRFPTTKRRLDLAALDRRLRERHDVDLLALLAAAGCPPTARREARLAARAHRESTADALAASACERLGDAPWVAGWVDAVRPGIDGADHARRAVEVVDRVLDAADPGQRRSRAEVAALVLDGGAHRLDRGTEERRWVRTALAARAGTPDRDDPALWSEAGLPGDLVSAPVLTWALPLRGDGVAAAVRALTVAGAPASLTPLTLRDLAIDVAPGTVVLSVENPRLLEAAVQRRLPAATVCTNGNPTAPATRLLRALVAAGAVVHHHGDVDPAGLAITARLAGDGVVPWRMGVDEYRAAVARAGTDGVTLPAVTAPVPPTPWCPALAGEVARRGVAVEQERVMEDVLAAHARTAGR